MAKKKQGSKKKVTPAAPKSAAAKNKMGVKSAVVKGAKNKVAHKPKKKSATKRADIIQLILEHHKPLKKLISTLKKPELGRGEKAEAFDEFAPLLLAHAEPEEQTLYDYMKERDDLRVEGFEGSTEHAIASQLIDQIEGCEDDDEWNAKVKVLAEAVEHHIEEEEEEMLPDFKKDSSPEERFELAQQYEHLRNSLLADEGFNDDE